MSSALLRRTHQVKVLNVKVIGIRGANGGVESPTRSAALSLSGGTRTIGRRAAEFGNVRNFSRGAREASVGCEGDSGFAVGHLSGAHRDVARTDTSSFASANASSVAAFDRECAGRTTLSVDLAHTGHAGTRVAHNSDTLADSLGLRVGRKGLPVGGDRRHALVDGLAPTFAFLGFLAALKSNVENDSDKNSKNGNEDSSSNATFGKPSVLPRVTDRLEDGRVIVRSIGGGDSAIGTPGRVLERKVSRVERCTEDRTLGKGCGKNWATRLDKSELERDGVDGRVPPTASDFGLNSRCEDMVFMSH